MKRLSLLTFDTLVHIRLQSLQASLFGMNNEYVDQQMTEMLFGLDASKYVERRQTIN